MSTGNDQRLKTWLVTIKDENPGVQGLSVSREGNEPCSVADVSCMELMTKSKSERVWAVVAGIGMEMWEIS